MLVLFSFELQIPRTDLLVWNSNCVTQTHEIIYFEKTLLKGMAEKYWKRVQNCTHQTTLLLPFFR